jgi:UDP-glucose 4,6-dehydratase
MYTPENILLTGGLGFIGSNLANFLAEKYNVIVVDKHDYCSRISNITSKNIVIYQVDINYTLDILKIMETHHIDTVFHCAANSHVDLSYSALNDFIKNNILGTYALLDVCRVYGQIKRFIHVSTDEIYGFNENIEGFKEDAPMLPTNPYAATKCAAEHAVYSYYKSHQIPIIITRSNNVMGRYQYPEKVISKFIVQLLSNKSITLQNSGQCKRSFIYIDNLVNAFDIILHQGVIGEIYNIGSEDEYKVIDLALMLNNIIYPDRELLTIGIPDRNFNDIRYHINYEKIKSLGWHPIISFEDGLIDTINYYKEHLSEYQFLV